MLDYGFTDTLPHTDLRALPKELCALSQFCLRCYFADIQPAGDITRWSQTSKETLVALLDNATYYLDVIVSSMSLVLSVLSVCGNGEYFTFKCICDNLCSAA